VFFNVYTDGGGKVTVLHPHRSLLTSCSGLRIYIDMFIFEITKSQFAVQFL